VLKQQIVNYGNFDEFEKKKLVKERVGGCNPSIPTLDPPLLYVTTELLTVISVTEI